MKTLYLFILSTIISTSALAQCEAFFTYTLGDGGEVFFDNQSVWNGNNVVFDWQFGDVGMSSDSNPSFTFLPGEYTVCLTISSTSCITDYCETLVIPQPCNPVVVELESMIDPISLITLDWNLEDESGVALEDGLMEFVMGINSGVLEFCLNDGCYTLTVNTSGNFSPNSLLYVLESDLPILVYDINYTVSSLTLSFGINADCSNEPCPTEAGFGPAEICGCYFFEIGSLVDGESVTWDFGDGVVETGGHFADHCYESNGVYLVNAVYSSPTCPQETFTFEVAVDCANNCNIDVAYSVPSCGLYVFEANNYPADALLHWYVDGNDVAYQVGVDVVTVEFNNPGEHSVCVSFETPDCPQGVVWCETLTVEPCGGCSVDYDFGPLGACGCYGFEVGALSDSVFVEWDFGDGTTLLGGHYAEHCFENNGMYTVSAYYTSPECSGETYLFEVEVTCFEIPGCPSDIWMSESSTCGCYEFEIGWDEEGVEVIWDFGDGTELTGGHYTEHCYAEDGEYSVTAWYTSPQCEGMEYSMGVAQVSCNAPPCTEVTLNIESAPNSNVGYVEWLVSDMNEVGLVDGNCDLANPLGACETVLCLEDGCYFVEVWSNTPINLDSFNASAWTMDGVLPIVEGPFMAGEFHMYFVFSLNGDCTSEPCSLSLSLTDHECGWYLFEASDFPSNVDISWQVDGITTDSTGPLFDWTFEEGGAHIVCAFYESPNCETGIWSCYEFTVDLCTGGCPTDFYAGPWQECGCFEFEVGAVNADVFWDFGDGTTFSENHYATHCYEAPGLYMVTVEYTSADCPDGTILTTEVLVECGNCTEISFAFDSNPILGGPESVEWLLSDINGNPLQDGWCEYGPDSVYCDAFACLEDGCYQMDIWLSSPISDELAFFTAAFLGDVQLEYAGDLVWDGDLHLTYTFGINSDCSVGLPEIEKNSLVLYPIPTSNLLYLEAAESWLGSTYKVVDLNGKIVISGRITTIYQPISLDLVADGIYQFVVLGNASLESRKIQVLR